MTPAAPHQPHWSTGPVGRWYHWRRYLVRWLLFGLVVSVFQPLADDVSPVWLHKIYQALLGLTFGAICAVVFTLAENRFNTPRVRWKSWLIVLGTWLVVKVCFVSTIAMMD